MRTTTLFIIMIAMMATAISADITRADAQDSNAGILDGMIFSGHVGPKGQEANGEDDVVFQNGKLLSTSCTKYGFESAPYTAHRDGDTIIFTAVTRSPEHGQIDWQGKIDGEKIEASYRWTKERWYWFDANEENWLKARLKKE